MSGTKDKVRGKQAIDVAQFVGKTRTINSQTIRILSENNARDVLFCSGTVTVTDGGSGYAKGCLYIKTDAATGTSGVYKNDGTNTSCVFNLVNNSPATILYTQVALTNANMLDLRATPITLVSAPGSGKMIEFISAELFFDYAGAYTESADNMAIKYADGSGTAVSETIEATGFVDATADSAIRVAPATSAVIAKTACENKALVLHNTGDGEYGGGNAGNEVLVSVAYRIHNTGF